MRMKIKPLPLRHQLNWASISLSTATRTLPAIHCHCSILRDRSQITLQLPKLLIFQTMHLTVLLLTPALERRAMNLWRETNRIPSASKIPSTRVTKKNRVFFFLFYFLLFINAIKYTIYHRWESIWKALYFYVLQQHLRSFYKMMGQGRTGSSRKG